ncbi:hypothetical protein MC885_020305, partial [Smutsia gigantea]
GSFQPPGAGRGRSRGGHVAPPGRAPLGPAKLGGVCPAIGYVGFPGGRAPPWAARSVGGGLSPGPGAAFPEVGKRAPPPASPTPPWGPWVRFPAPSRDSAAAKWGHQPALLPRVPGGVGLKLLLKLWGAGNRKGAVGWEPHGGPLRTPALRILTPGPPALQGKSRARPKGAPQARTVGSQARRPQGWFAGAGGEVGAGGSPQVGPAPPGAPTGH